MKPASNNLPRSIEICECLDGPYEGHIVRIGARAGRVEVRDLFDSAKPRATYEVVWVGSNKELRWRP